MILIKRSFAFCSLLLLSCLLISPAFAAPSWQIQVTSSTSPTCHAVQALSDTTVVAAGANGQFHKTTDRGITWTTVSATDAAYTLYGISFPSATTGYLCGTDNSGTGVILKTTDGGANWNPIYGTQIIPVFYDVFFATDNRGWAVGQFDRIFNTSDGGANWTNGEPTPTPVNALHSVHARYSSTAADYYVWTTGEDGKIYFSATGGSGIAEQISGASTRLTDVYFVDENTGWIVGNSGVILKTTNAGTTWTSQTSGITTNLNGVHFLDASNGWAAGAGGKILMTTTGGSTWSDMSNSLTTYDLNDVSFSSTYNGWVVGGGSRVIAKYGGPTISSVTPNSGTVGSTLNTSIDGANFSSAIAVGNISFGAGITVNSVTFNSSTSLTVNLTITTGAATGPRNVTITGPDQISGTLANGFTVTSAVSNPQPSYCNPSFMASPSTSQPLIIYGTNFDAGASSAVEVSIPECTVTVVNSTSTAITVYVTIPSGVSGWKNVSIVNKLSGGSAILKNGLIVTSPGGPVISNMTRDWAYAGANNFATTIVGSGFLPGATVAFSPGDGIKIKITSVRDTGTEIDIVIDVDSEDVDPDKAIVGLKAIGVTNASGLSGSSANIFEVRSGAPVAGGEKIRSVIAGPSPLRTRNPDDVVRIHVDVTPSNTFPFKLEVPIISPAGQIMQVLERTVTAPGMVNIDFHPNRNSTLTNQRYPNGPYVMVCKIGNSVEKKFKYFIAR